MGLPSRASTILRDVKRRSLRSYRAATAVEKKERRLSGTFLQLGEDSTGTRLAEDLGQVPPSPTTTTNSTATHHQREDKENLMPEAFSPKSPAISRTQSLRRRCSNYFTPKSKRANRERAASIRTPSTRRPSVSRRTSLSSTPVKDSPKAFVSGPGRLIPVKQG